MGKRTSYSPGTFSWVELATVDGAGAKQFYGSLFGWDFDDIPVGEGMVYSMAILDGERVAALYEMGPDMRERDVPPNWLSYVTVEDADAAAARAAELGGNIHAQAFDVTDVGRMALIQDPAGAIFAVWQPKTSIGATLVNVTGALTWNELGTPDAGTAAEFYSGLFGWTTQAMEGASPPYSIIMNGERSNGGIRGFSDMEKDMPPYWLAYFLVPSVTAFAVRVGEVGGSVLAGPIEVPAGKFVVARDPQGAVFAGFEGDADPDPE
jgi:predicted enzyme related to lactoylglutathione lyase